MGNPLVERHQALKDKLDRARQAQSRVEAEHKLATEQTLAVVKEIRDLGIEPEKLPTVIAQLEQEIAQEQASIESALSALPPLDSILNRGLTAPLAK